MIKLRRILNYVVYRHFLVVFTDSNSLFFYCLNSANLSFDPKLFPDLKLFKHLYLNLSSRSLAEILYEFVDLFVFQELLQIALFDAFFCCFPLRKVQIYKVFVTVSLIDMVHVLLYVHLAQGMQKLFFSRFEKDWDKGC